MGRWSRLLAAEFLAWLEVAPGANWLEIGCGTGALTSAILESAKPASVTACDTAADFVRYCASNLRHPDCVVVTATTDTLPRREPGYDVVASSLVLNFLPDPVAGLARMREVCATHGCVAACVWDYSEGMEFLRLFWDAAMSLDPRSKALDEAVRFPLCRAEEMRSAFLRAGLERVAIESLTVPTRFASFDDFWLPFVDGPGPAPTYVASISETRRSELAALLRVRVPQGPDGEIHLRARAWAAKGLCSAP
jgi:ubiquinone/menaquinone biosynthesis C-methylase UbiE